MSLSVAEHVRVTQRVRDQSLTVEWFRGSQEPPTWNIGGKFSMEELRMFLNKVEHERAARP